MANQNGTSKNERRQHARDLAKQRQEQQRKRRLRNRIFLQGGLGLGILAIVAIVILVIVNTNSGSASVASTTGPKNMATNGIIFTGSNGKAVPVLTSGIPAKGTAKPVAATNSNGTPKVVTYIDWSCPSCKQFEAAYSTKLLGLVASGKATLEIHPISILDSHYPGSRYASRAANAAACVANFHPDDFLAVQAEFYDNQPDEGTKGLTNDQIKALVVKGGVTDAKVASCIDQETFKSWVTAATNQTLANKALSTDGSFGTPTVVINGKKWDQSGDLISRLEKS